MRVCVSATKTNRAPQGPVQGAGRESRPAWVWFTRRSVAAAAVATAAVATATAVATTAAFATATAATTVAATAAFTTTAAEAATTTTTTTVTAAVGAAETSGTFFTGASFVDDHSAAGHGLTVQAVDRGLCFGVRAHFHETEALGATGFTVHHDLGGTDGTILGESVTQILITHGVGQIAHVKFVAHE